MPACRSSFCATACSVGISVFATLAAASEADLVTLRMKGGGFEISGVLLGADGTKYVVRSATQGTLSLDANRFDCIGDPCSKRAGTAAAISPALADRPRASAPEQLSVQGADGIAATIMPEMIRGYAATIGATATQIVGAKSSDVRFRIADARKAELAGIDVVRNGTAAGLAALEQGQAAIAMIERPYVVGAAPAAGRGNDRQEAPIALDGSAVVVAPGNALTALTADIMAEIFSGRVTDWADLGFPSRLIKLYATGPSTGTFETFNAQVLAPRKVALAASAIVLSTDAEVATAVAADPDAIGLTSISAIGPAVGVGLDLACGLVVRPTGFAIKSGEYPLGRQLSLQASSITSLASARGLMRYAASKEMETLVADAQLIDRRIELLPFDDQAGRIATAVNAPASDFDMGTMRQLVGDIAQAKRLSLMLRFPDGGIDLNAVTQRDVQRIAQFLQEPDMAGKTIYLMGFSSSGGKFDVTQRVSMKRSIAVRNALIAALRGSIDKDRIVARGYGALASIGCNTSASGQQLNRRVEVWVR